MTARSIVVLDFGGQYTQLIARRVREQNVFSVILPFNASWNEIERHQPAGIILSGGPASVYDPDAPMPAPEVLRSGRPVLGICYGLQTIVHQLGGKVLNAPAREYGRAEIEIDGHSCLFARLGSHEAVWMSHGDEATQLPSGFRVSARSNGRRGEIVAAIEDAQRRIWAVQFHPEVRHTEHGREVLANFLFDICGLTPDWTPLSFIDRQVEEIRATVGSGHAICALSGGVDSSVAATLVHRAIGDRLTCVFVNNGVLRKNEFEKVQHSLRDRLGLNLRAVDASEQFLRNLKMSLILNKKERLLAGNSSLFSTPRLISSHARASCPAFLSKERSIPT
jgi:GMP synthase (glutamine-hydrolysing)